MNNIIENLVEGHKKIKPIMPLKVYLALYVVSCLCLFILTVLVLPTRENLHNQLEYFHYYFETIIWFSVGLLGAITAYKLMIPGQKFAHYYRALIFLVLALFVSLLTRVSYASLGHDFFTELDIYRGYCGPIIFLLGTALFFCMSKAFKKGYALYPKQLYFTIACSVGSIGSISMQYICAHETAVHALLWHCPPFVALAFLSSKLLKKNN